MVTSYLVKGCLVTLLSYKLIMPNRIPVSVNHVNQIKNRTIEIPITTDMLMQMRLSEGEEVTIGQARFVVVSILGSSIVDQFTVVLFAKCLEIGAENSIYIIDDPTEEELNASILKAEEGKTELNAIRKDVRNYEILGDN